MHYTNVFMYITIERKRKGRSKRKRIKQDQGYIINKIPNPYFSKYSKNKSIPSHQKPRRL